MKRNLKFITFVIHPTEYGDFDCLAIGDTSLLSILVTKCNGFHFIKKSKFGGIPLVIMDTFDTIKDANRCIGQYRTKYIKDMGYEMPRLPKIR